MNCDKYQEVSTAMEQLMEAAIEEVTLPVNAGTSEKVQLILKKLDALGDDAESFSKAARGEIRRTVAMVEAINPGHQILQQPKERLPGSIDKRRKEFSKIREKDCGT